MSPVAENCDVCGVSGECLFRRRVGSPIVTTRRGLQRYNITSLYISYPKGMLQMLRAQGVRSKVEGSEFKV